MKGKDQVLHIIRCHPLRCDLSFLHVHHSSERGETSARTFELKSHLCTLTGAAFSSSTEVDRFAHRELPDLPQVKDRVYNGARGPIMGRPEGLGEVRAAERSGELGEDRTT